MLGNKGQKRSLLTVIELGDICAHAGLTVGAVAYSTHPPRCGPPVSLRLGHARGLTTHRVVIQDPRAASLPHKGRLSFVPPLNCNLSVGLKISNDYKFLHGYKYNCI